MYGILGMLPLFNPFNIIHVGFNGGSQEVYRELLIFCAMLITEDLLLGIWVFNVHFKALCYGITK